MRDVGVYCVDDLERPAGDDVLSQGRGWAQSLATGDVGDSDAAVRRLLQWCLVQIRYSSFCSALRTSSANGNAALFVTFCSCVFFSARRSSGRRPLYNCCRAAGSYSERTDATADLFSQRRAISPTEQMTVIDQAGPHADMARMTNMTAQRWVYWRTVQSSSNVLRASCMWARSSVLNQVHCTVYTDLS